MIAKLTFLPLCVVMTLALCAMVYSAPSCAQSQSLFSEPLFNAPDQDTDKGQNGDNDGSSLFLTPAFKSQQQPVAPVYDSPNTTIVTQPKPSTTAIRKPAASASTRSSAGKVPITTSPNGAPQIKPIILPKPTIPSCTDKERAVYTKMKSLNDRYIAALQPVETKQQPGGFMSYRYADGAQDVIDEYNNTMNRLHAVPDQYDRFIKIMSNCGLHDSYMAKNAQ